MGACPSVLRVLCALLAFSCGGHFLLKMPAHLIDFDFVNSIGSGLTLITERGTERRMVTTLQTIYHSDVWYIVVYYPNPNHMVLLMCTY